MSRSHNPRASPLPSLTSQRHLPPPAKHNLTNTYITAYAPHADKSDEEKEEFYGYHPLEEELNPEFVKMTQMNDTNDIECDTNIDNTIDNTTCSIQPGMMDMGPSICELNLTQQ